MTPQRKLYERLDVIRETKAALTNITDRVQLFDAVQVILQELENQLNERLGELEAATR